MAQTSSARMGTDTPGGGSVPTIEHLLIDIVGTTNVDTGADIGEDDTHDEALTGTCVRPLAVVRPGSTADVASIVKAAASLRMPLTPRGSGTGLSGGCGSSARRTPPGHHRPE